MDVLVPLRDVISGLTRQAWILQTAVVAGSGIWATHFIAMLAFKSTLPTTYDPLLTLWSLLIAIAVTGVGFCIAGSEDSKPKIVAAGTVIGLGIATMHYSGMNAMSIAGRIQWDMHLVTVSILLGIGFAIAAMWGFKIAHSKLLAAALLTAAICTLHFTAMGAAAVQYDPTIVASVSPVDNTLLATAISGVTLLAILSGLTAALINVEAARESQDLRQIADHDYLTGLPNRGFISRVIDRLVGEANDSKGDFAILFVDLDRFKGVNDDYGHAAGDYVLQQAATRLQEATRGYGVVARTGGDEFIVVVSSSACQAAVDLLTEAILSAFSQPFEVRWGTTATLGVSIGAAFYPQDGHCAETVLRAADQALYRAKRTGGRVAILAA